MGTPISEARQIIAAFLQCKSAEVLAISGGWGTGKTFMWNDTLQKTGDRGEVGKPIYSYVSLFGISSIDALKLAIYEAGEFTPGASKRSEKSALGRFKRRIPGFGKYLPYAPAATLAKNLEPLFFQAVKQQIVCIDDIERRGAGLSMNEILGLVTYLKEQRSCNVALILNTDALGQDQKAYSEQIEKVVDLEIKIAPSPLEASQIALDFESSTDLLISTYSQQLGIKNVRVIRKIRKLVTAAALHLSNYHPRVLDQAVKTLTLVGWVQYEPLAAPREWLENAIELARNPSDFDDFIPDEEDMGKESDVQIMMRHYQMDYLDPFDLELLEGAKRSFFDAGTLKPAADLVQREIEVLDGSNTIRDAWISLHESFDDNESDVVDPIIEVMERCLPFASLIHLNQAVRFLRIIDRGPQAAQLLEKYQKARASDFWDLDGPYLFGRVETDVRDAAKAAHAPNVREPIAILESWTESSPQQAEIKAIAELGVDGLFKIFTSARGGQLQGAIRGALIFSARANRSEKEELVLENAKQALKRIASTSRLNAFRCEQFGLYTEASE